jgi:hypothetical protein
MNHPSVFRQARSRLAQSGGADAFHRMRILAPLEGLELDDAILQRRRVASRRTLWTPPSRLLQPL